MSFNEDSEVLKKMMIPAIMEEEGDLHIECYKGIEIFFSRNSEKCWQAEMFVENDHQHGISVIDYERLKELSYCKRFDDPLIMETQKNQNCYFAIDDESIIVKSYGFPPSKLNDYIKYIESKDEIKEEYNTFLFNYRYEKDYVTLNDIINNCKIFIDRILDNSKIKNS